MSVQPPANLQDALLQETLGLAKEGHPYVFGSTNGGLDCSATTRKIYRDSTGIDIGTTASDQYLHLYREGQIHGPPRDGSGQVNSQALAQELKPGDLLFFKNTYRPDASRGSDVTHVMIYLGQDKQGNMLMAGSQQSRGYCNPAGSGPDVYTFDPNQARGGFMTMQGRVKGEFCGFGSPAAVASADRSASPVPVNMPQRGAIGSFLDRTGQWLGGRAGQAVGNADQNVDDGLEEIKQLIGLLVTLFKTLAGGDKEQAKNAPSPAPGLTPQSLRVNSVPEPAPGHEPSPAPVVAPTQQAVAAPVNVWANAVRSANVARPGFAVDGPQVTHA